MSKHKHAEIIKAKADNMELVVFCNGPHGKKWHAVDSEWPSFNDDFDYFLCLPKHNENDQCLHWLNGGNCQEKGIKARECFWSDEFADLMWSRDWNEDHVFMEPAIVTRIKPSKEKRFALVGNDFRMGVMTFNSKEELEKHYAREIPNGQIVEFDVEV